VRICSKRPTHLPSRRSRQGLLHISEAVEMEVCVCPVPLHRYDLQTEKPRIPALTYMNGRKPCMPNASRNALCMRPAKMNTQARSYNRNSRQPSAAAVRDSNMQQQQQQQQPQRTCRCAAKVAGVHLPSKESFPSGEGCQLICQESKEEDPTCRSPPK